MPGYLTHIIFGQKVFPSTLKNVRMFNFGLMGPDIFYYDISDPKYELIAQTLHEVDLSKFINEMKKESPEYALGVYLHSYLDLKMHPRINFLERTLHLSHTKIETIVDAAILKKEWKTTIFRVNKNFFPQKLPARFMRIFDETLYNYYEIEDIKIKDLYNTFLKNFNFLYKFYPIKAIGSHVLYICTLGKYNYKDYFIFKMPSEDILNDYGINVIWKESLSEVNDLIKNF